MKSLINYIKENTNTALNNLWKTIKDLNPKLNPMEKRSYDIADTQQKNGVKLLMKRILNTRQ